MKKTAILHVQNLPSTAQLLYQVMNDLEAAKDAYKRTVAPLEAQEDELRAKLLGAMQKGQVKTVKTEDGTVFMRVSKTTFEVTDERKAYLWGEKNNCLRLDKVGANKILTRTIGVPEGFEQKDTEHISIKRTNQE